MTLPDFKEVDVKFTKITPAGLDFRGEKTNYLRDSLNLEYESGCRTRNSRKMCFPFPYPPGQIITCKDRVFFCIANKFAEIIDTKKGCTMEEFRSMELIPVPPPRLFLEYKDDILIFPDMLRFNTDNSGWSPFAEGFNTKVKFPLINEYAFFYPFGESGTVTFAEAERLIPGTKIQFSWMNHDINIIKREKVIKTTFDEETQTEIKTEEGLAVWLDKPVTGCLVPNDGTAEIMIEDLRPAADKFYLGCGNRGGSFSGSSIKYNITVGEYTYVDDPENYFGVGQKVTISGATVKTNNLTATVTDISPGKITFDTAFTDEAFTEGQIIEITPVLPHVDFACAIDGRLFIADNEQKVLMASKVGKPMVFYGGMEKEEGSWRCDLNEDCTGLTAYKNQVICFQKSGGFKVYGTNSQNFSPVKLPVSGIETGKKDTLCALRDTLFYVSPYGVMKYSGTVDSKISSPVNIKSPTAGLAAGLRYYLLDGDKIYVYSLEKDCWWCEDGSNVICMFMKGGRLYYAKEEGIYLADGEEIPFKWSLETSQFPLEDGYKAQPISLNVQLSSKKGCEIYAYMRARGKENYTLLFGKWASGESALKVPLKKMWCDGFSLKLSGKGDIELKNITVKYRRKNLC